MKVAHTKIFKWIAIGATACVVILGLTYWAAASFTETYTAERFKALNSHWDSEYARYQSRIESDLALLADSPIYPDLAKMQNAEPFLRKYLTWKSDTSGSAPEGTEFENEKRATDFLEKHPLSKFSEATWTSILGDPELSQLKLSWLDQLISYDHFNLATHPSHVEAIERASHVNGIGKIRIATSLPLPDYNSLQAFAFFRFAQLAQQGNEDDGAKLYRHVSYLIWTSNHLVSSLVAMSMLEREQILAKALGFYPIEVVDQPRIDAMKSLSWLWGSVYRDSFVANHFEAFKNSFVPETGACASAGESMIATSGLSAMFEKTAPLEQDFSENFKRSKKLDEKIIKMCGLEAYAPFFKTDGESQAPLTMFGFDALSVDPNLKWLPLPGSLPIARRFIGATIISVASPSGFGMYEKTAREPASK